MTDTEKQALGLSVIPDFITKEEEAAILSQLKKTPPQTKTSRNSVRRYGSKKPYQFQPISSETIPEVYDKISDKIMAAGLLDTKPDSITVNEYHKDQFIGYHVDSPASGDVITVLSLGVDAVINFKKDKQTVGAKLPARSLVQMRDEIRWDWEHATTPAKGTRYSIVFRCSKDVVDNKMK